MMFVRMVQQKMKSRRLSIRQVCRLAGVDPSFLAKVLRGERQPPQEERVLKRLARALETEPTEMILAAGRFPSSWQARLGDPAVQRGLERIFSEMEPAPSPLTPSSRRGPRPPVARRGRDAERPTPRERSRPVVYHRPSAELSEDLL